MVNDIEEVLISEEAIKAKVKELGRQITEDYKDGELMVIGILNGAFMFMSDLVRSIDRKIEMDFMAISSYGDSTESGNVRLLKDVEKDISNKHIILVEDIVDTGLTLDYLRRIFLERKPLSLKICALLDKPSRRKINLELDYKGFEVPNKFIVGYGLDFAGEYRNIPYVAYLKEEIYK